MDGGTRPTGYHPHRARDGQTRRWARAVRRPSQADEMPFGTWLSPSKSPAAAKAKTQSFCAFVCFYDFRRMVVNWTIPRSFEFLGSNSSASVDLDQHRSVVYSR